MSGPASQRITAVVLGGITLAGCSGPVDVNVADGGFSDGTFTGRSAPDDLGEWGEVSLTIAANDITEVSFALREPDGTIKDEDYGKTNGQVIDENAYEKAQAGVVAAPKYAVRLEETDDLGAVDSITGASISYRQFVEAVTDALGMARLES